MQLWESFDIEWQKPDIDVSWLSEATEDDLKKFVSSLEGNPDRVNAIISGLQNDLFEDLPEGISIDFGSLINYIKSDHYINLQNENIENYKSRISEILWPINSQKKGVELSIIYQSVNKIYWMVLFLQWSNDWKRFVSSSELRNSKDFDKLKDIEKQNSDFYKKQSKLKDKIIWYNYGDFLYPNLKVQDQLKNATFSDKCRYFIDNVEAWKNWLENEKRVVDDIKKIKAVMQEYLDNSEEFDKVSCDFMWYDIKASDLNFFMNSVMWTARLFNPKRYTEIASVNENDPQYSNFINWFSREVKITESELPTYYPKKVSYNDFQKWEREQKK